MTTPRHPQPPRSAGGRRWVAVLVCWLALLVGGFPDLLLGVADGGPRPPRRSCCCVVGHAAGHLGGCLCHVRDGRPRSAVATWVNEAPALLRAPRPLPVPAYGAWLPAAVTDPSSSFFPSPETPPPRTAA